MTLVGGTGSLSAAGRAAWDAGAASISPKTYTGKAMALVIAMDTMAWYYDYKYAKFDAGHPKKNIADLFALVRVDGVMMWVGGVLTEVLLASLFASVAIALGSSAATIGVIAVGTVIIIVGINYALTATSNAVDANNKVAKLIRSTGKILEQDIPRDYGDAYSQSTWPMLAIGATP
ncbi:hypothetical protein [Paraburkholderia bannensis]|uniref:hypothetical protein n=1 Tax=Paraburkholderia bannensis TaxID=765414 RepID=UPI002AB706C7|nr:hypothetical protein [Paraburkholderia bannensis]